MTEYELAQKIAEMCSGCAFANPENGACKLVPPFLSKMAQEQKSREGFCAEAGVFDGGGNVLKAINYRDNGVWVLTVQ